MIASRLISSTSGRCKNRHNVSHSFDCQNCIPWRPRYYSSSRTHSWGWLRKGWHTSRYMSENAGSPKCQWLPLVGKPLFPRVSRSISSPECLRFPVYSLKHLRIPCRHAKSIWQEDKAEEYWQLIKVLRQRPFYLLKYTIYGNLPSKVSHTKKSLSL